MVSGPTSTLQPLRTITGAGGGGGGGGADNVSANNETSTTTLDTIDPDQNEASTSNNGPTPTTTRRGATATTAAAPSSAPSSSGGSTNTGGSSGNTPPPTSPIGACKAGELNWTTRTNKSSYRPNETVVISLHVRNASDRPCYAPAACGTGLSATVDDSSGNRVWQGSTAAGSCNAAGAPSAPLLNPSDGYSYGAAGSWDQITCPSGSECARAAIGSYRATASRGATVATGATFGLR